MWKSAIDSSIQDNEDERDTQKLRAKVKIKLDQEGTATNFFLAFLLANLFLVRCLAKVLHPMYYNH